MYSLWSSQLQVEGSCALLLKGTLIPDTSLFQLKVKSSIISQDTVSSFNIPQPLRYPINIGGLLIISVRLIQPHLIMAIVNINMARKSCSGSDISFFMPSDHQSRLPKSIFSIMVVLFLGQFVLIDPYFLQRFLYFLLLNKNVIDLINTQWDIKSAKKHLSEVKTL